MQVGARKSNDAYISILPSSRQGLNSKRGKMGSRNSDSKRSLHAISISADPNRADSRAGSSMGKSSQTCKRSIIGMLSERLKAGDLFHKAMGGGSLKPAVDTGFVYPFEGASVTIDHSGTRGAMLARPKTVIKTTGVRTELAEKQKLVDNILRNNHVKLRKESDMMDQFTKDSRHAFQSKESKQAQYLAKMGGDKSPMRR